MLFLPEPRFSISLIDAVNTLCRWLVVSVFLPARAGVSGNPGGFFNQGEWVILNRTGPVKLIWINKMLVLTLLVTKLLTTGALIAKLIWLNQRTGASHEK